MNSSPKSASPQALTVAGDLLATTIDPMATRLEPPRGGGPSDGVQVAWATATATATVRNVTNLPMVEGSGAEVQLKPRSETRYQVVQHLGAGAMGEVNLAQDNDIGRKVALKQLVPGSQNASGVARFIDEIRTIGQLEHPNIVPIHDVGVDQHGQIFFVMKYIDGETLESIIRKLQAGDPAYLARYTIDYRMEIFMGILHALQCAHEKGVIHRDIKPANIMVGRLGEVVLMDWGVAKVRPPAGEAAGQRKEFVGTPAYMSPEQADGSPAAVDPRSDLYSATVLFHELLGLRHYLAQHTNVQQLLVAIAWEQFAALRLSKIHHPNQTPPPTELLHFVAKGLAKKQEQRFQSAREMLDELQAIRDGRIPIRCPATLAKRMTTEIGLWLGRSPIVSMVAFYCVLMIVLGCVGFTVRGLIIHTL